MFLIKLFITPKLLKSSNITFNNLVIKYFTLKTFIFLRFFLVCESVQKDNFSPGIVGESF